MYVGATLPSRCGLQSRAQAAESCAPGKAESKLVQVKKFHRGEPETRRNREVGDDATEGTEVSCGARRRDSHLSGLAALRDEREISDRSQDRPNGEE